MAGSPLSGDRPVEFEEDIEAIEIDWKTDATT